MTKLQYNQNSKKCLVCNHGLEKILDLGMHPYADTFINESQLGISEPVLPLEVFLCQKCSGIQLGYLSNDFERYNLYSYSYTSANSAFSRNHWDKYAETMIKRFDIKGKSVIEIGSNDGYLINKFKENNKVIGIDPSKTVAQIAKSTYGIQTITDLFSLQNSNRVKKKFGKANLIIANNVFNHSNKPLDFAKGVKNLLTEDGVFVFEMPYWLDTIQSKKFDQIYHEHVSYFTVKSSYNLLAKAGLEIFDTEEVEYHGGSLRIYAKPTKDDSPKKIKKVQDMINKEEKFGLFKISTYIKFQKDITLVRDKFLSKVFNLKAKGFHIIAVGAAAKGNTFLNFYKLDKTIIDFVTDSSKHKQGKYTPLTRIPIVGDEIFKKYKKVYALILSWNISTTLKKNLKKINSEITFI